MDARVASDVIILEEAVASVVGPVAALLIVSYSKQKKGTTKVIPFKKIGGDLLFHKQVQYHRRCEA